MVYYYLPGEQEAVDKVIATADRWGYGNLIWRLMEAWAAKERAAGMDAHTANMCAGIVCVWCKVDRRTGKATPAPGATGSEGGQDG